MRLGSATWAGILLMSTFVTSCTRSTPANTQSNQAQPTPNTAALPSPAPSPEAKPKTAVPPAGTQQPSSKAQPQNAPEQTAQQETPAPTPAPPPPVVLPAGTVVSVRLNTPVGSQSSKMGDKF